MLSSLASRRQVIRLAIASVANLCSCLSLLATAEQSGGDLDWNGFINELTELSKSYSPSQEDERNYVRSLSRLLEALDHKGRSVREVIRTFQRPRTDEVTGALIHETTEFEVVLLSLEKGQYFPYHNHPSMTGVSMCISGQIDVHNLDVVGKVNASTLLLRDSAHEQINSGKVSWLTSNVRNIHRVQASKASQLIDFFTPPYTAERVTQTRWYEVEPVHTGGDLYRAHLL
jgi:hypothetical protein